MKKLTGFILLLLFSSILISCAQSTQTPAISDEMIGPGDKIGDMLVVQGTYPSTYPLIWIYCEFWFPETEPASFTSDCTVPSVPGLALSFGWSATATMFASSWNAVTYELYVDGYQVDLDKFTWEDDDSPDAGPNARSRYMVLYLENLSIGSHSFRYLWSTEAPVDDGFAVYQPGTYEHVINFTVAEPEVYPVLSVPISAGQYRYRSEAAGLDYILYVPDDYGVDPQDKWPLILYLHGLDVGAMNSMDLLEEGIPLPPENQSDFPFIMVSPQGTFEYADYEIWSTDEMINSLMTLLDEVNDFVDVDSSRIYLNGFSAGGNGTWGVGLQHPDYFAALVPIAGYYGWPFTVPENICDLKDVPVWAFHGAKDEAIPLEAEQNLVDALEACGGNVQFTIFPDIGHDVESQQVYTPELFSWLLEQERR